MSGVRKYFYNSNLKAIPILDRKQLVGVITSKILQMKKLNQI